MGRNVLKKIAYYFLALSLLVPAPASVYAADGEGEVEVKPAESQDKPVFKNASVHDPSVIKVDDTYYVLGSHLAMAKTKDLMQWDKVADGVNAANPLFDDVTKELAEALDWAESETLWAGDIIQLEDGKFYMYYNACKGDSPRSALGVAVADHIEGPYKDLGIFLKSGMWNETSEDGTIYDATVHPNVIDPHTFFDAENRLWMVYGSYSGGIFILELNPETGFPYPDQGYGKHLIGGNHSRIEGPYIQYDPNTEYYYLYTTFGGLAAGDGYNMRVARSKNPDGPYVDAEGNDMSKVKADRSKPLFDDESIKPYGVKLMGDYLFTRNPGEAGVDTGYVSAGHNSVYYDEATGQHFLIFHTRFPGRGEAHEIRVHQMFMNADGWPVVAPYRYAEETLQAVSKADISGDYKFINHGKEIVMNLATSTTITLKEDGTISGPVTGSWELSDDYHATLKVNGETYKGVFLRQWDPTTENYNLTFTALSGKGVAVWGSKTVSQTDKQLVDTVKNELDLGDTSGIIANLSLPTAGANGVKISWESSNRAVISTTGVVTRPSAGADNVQVTLTATITKGAYAAKKSFEITVLAEKVAGLVAHYQFEDDLTDETGNVSEGTVTGDRIDKQGGTISFTDGKVGKAAKFDGASGILLPKGLIASNQYTVSFWLNPEQLTGFTTSFFGARATNSWISFLPAGLGDAGKTMLWSGEAWYDAVTDMKINVNEWSHIAFSVNNGNVEVYINGVNKFTGKNFPNIFTTQNAVFGLGVNYWDLPYKGLIDELLIYDNGNLTEEQIQDYYETGEIPELETPINTTKLQQLIHTAKQYVEGSFTEASLSALQTAISDAEAALETVTTETELNQAIADLQAAINGLVEIKQPGLSAYYSFDGNLSDETLNAGDGTVTGDRIDNTDGQITFTEGVNGGQAAVFDGASGVKLPNGLISSYKYSFLYG